LVVDTFLRVYKDIAPVNGGQQPATTGLSAITRVAVHTGDAATATTSRFDDISASTEEMLLLYEMAQALSGKLDVADVADLISKHLRRLVPATTCVFFVYDSASDDLKTAHASGENASHFADIRIAVGQRLSGWVAANRQTILNSDPILDLGEVARVLKPPLRSCLSTALVADNDVIGVLTVYSTHRDAFTDDHRRIVEVVARQVSQTVRRAVDHKREHTEQLKDQFTGLPNRQHLERFIVSELSSSGGLPCSVVLVEATVGRSARPSRFDIAAAIRAALRGADLLFIYDSDRYVALLTQTDAHTADAVARQIANEISSLRTTDDSFTWRVGRATSPDDGLKLVDLVRAAESRGLPPSANRASIH
jgi:GGDEF domain-containing protein